MNRKRKRELKKDPNGTRW